MQWKLPEVGTMRIRTRFAIFPTSIPSDNVKIWLQRYYVVQEYYSGRWQTFPDTCHCLTYWGAVDFIKSLNRPQVNMEA